MLVIEKMSLWIALYSSGGSSVRLTEVEIEATNKRSARITAVNQCPKGHILYDLKRKTGKLGGKRPGSGQPKKYGCLTRPLRLPVNLVADQDSIDRILNIPVLQSVLADWEKECSENPLSDKHSLLGQVIQEIRSLGY